MANLFNDLTLIGVPTIVQNVASQTATNTSPAVTLKDNAANLTNFVLFVGAVTGTTPQLTVKVQESADGVTYTDAYKSDGTTPAAFAAVTASNSLQMIAVRVQKPFVQVVGTISGTTPNFTYGVGLLQQPKTAGTNTGGWINDAVTSYA